VEKTTYTKTELDDGKVDATTVPSTCTDEVKESRHERYGFVAMACRYGQKYFFVICYLFWDTDMFVWYKYMTCGEMQSFFARYITSVPKIYQVLFPKYTRTLFRKYSTSFW
jgi:hypothetical protein